MKTGYELLAIIISMSMALGVLLFAVGGVINKLIGG